MFQMMNMLDSQDVGNSDEISNNCYNDLKLKQGYASVKDTQRVNEYSASITEDDKSLKFDVKKGMAQLKGSTTHRSTNNLKTLKDKEKQRQNVKKEK